jgi:hypothetical protein
MPGGDPVAVLAGGDLGVQGVAGFARRFFEARSVLWVPALIKERNSPGSAQSAALCGLGFGRWTQLVVQMGGGKRKAKLGGEVAQAEQEGGGVRSARQSDQDTRSGKGKTQFIFYKMCNVKAKFGPCGRQVLKSHI